MPTYTFKRKSTGEEWTTIVSLSKREEILSDSDVEQLVIPKGNGSDGFIAGTGLKSDEGFRDILREIAKVSPGNNMDIR